MAEFRREALLENLRLPCTGIEVVDIHSSEKQEGTFKKVTKPAAQNNAYCPRHIGGLLCVCEVPHHHQHDALDRQQYVDTSARCRIAS